MDFTWEEASSPEGIESAKKIKGDVSVRITNPPSDWFIIQSNGKSKVAEWLLNFTGTDLKIDLSLTDCTHITGTATDAFKNCKALIYSPKLSDNLTKIDGMFSYSGIRVAPKIPKKAVQFWSIFTQCSSLVSCGDFPQIKNNINGSFSNAFSKCTKLEKVGKIPLTGIITNAFQGCKSLQEIDLSNLDDNYNYLQSSTNSDFVQCSNAFLNCTSLKKVILPKKVAFSGQNMFNGCTSLENVGTYIKVKDQFSGGFKNSGLKIAPVIDANFSKKSTYATGGKVQLSGIFDSCKNLEIIPPFFFPKLYKDDSCNVMSFFDNCDNIKNFTFLQKTQSDFRGAKKIRYMNEEDISDFNWMSTFCEFEKVSENGYYLNGLLKPSEKSQNLPTYPFYCIDYKNGFKLDVIDGKPVIDFDQNENFVHKVETCNVANMLYADGLENNNRSPSYIVNDEYRINFGCKLSLAGKFKITESTKVQVIVKYLTGSITGEITFAIYELQSNGDLVKVANTETKNINKSKPNYDSVYETFEFRFTDIYSDVLNPKKDYYISFCKKGTDQFHPLGIGGTFKTPQKPYNVFSCYNDSKEPNMYMRANDIFNGKGQNNVFYAKVYN